MLSIDSGKIDKFYLVLAATLVAMAILVIMAFRGVFSAYLVAFEIDQEILSAGLKVNKEKLDEVHDWVFKEENIPLNP